MKKKLSLLFLALVATMGAWATDVTVSTSTGTFYNDGTTAITPSSSNQFASKWTSTATGPQLTMTCSGNNMIINSGDATDTKFRLHGNNLTYTLTVDDGYLITGYSITGYAANGSSTINGTTVGTTADAATTVSSTSLTSATATFTVSGTANPWMYITDFTVTVEEDPDYVDWTPSITGAYVSVGEKVESFSAVTDPADNTKWYILTQVRGGETPMYNVSTGSMLKRAATSVTAASLNETLATASAAYLIRFVAAADAGTYNIQFADGDWITSSLTTASSKSSAGTYAFYNSNGGSGSYFAWNLNSTSGSIVDNNAAGGTLAFWGSGTVSGTSGNNVWYMYETDVEVPASTVDVTYNFVVGGSTVNTATVTVPANSAVSIPSGLTDGYSTDYYTIATSGTIGSEDCTITVTGTLNDATIVYPITSVSNGKAYYITTKNDARGSLTTYTDGTTTYLASEVKSALGVAEKKFAIVSYEDNYYLWSVSDNGFVTYSESQKAPVAATISDATDRVTFTQTTAPLYEIRFDGSTSKILNSSASYTYGMVFNTWGSSSSQWDDGCQYTIHEADDFDATAALAALEEYFHPTNYYSRVEEEVLPFLLDGENPSPTIGKPFGLSTDAATSIVTNYMTQLNNQQFSLEDYEGIVAAKDAGIIYPENGKFYVIKNVSNNKYLNVKSAGGIFADAAAPTAGSVVRAEIRDGKTYFATQGKEFGWCYGSGYAALLDAVGGGKYAHFSITAPGQVAFAHALGNGEGETYEGYLPYSYYSVGSENQVFGSTADAAAAQWTFEEASNFSIPLNDGGDGSYYATFCVPFDVTLDAATTAYTLDRGEGTELTMSEPITEVVAGTPVLLVGTSGSATATIGSNYTTTPVSGTALTGTYLEIANFDGATNYVLGTDGTKVGFFHWDGTTLKANRAYIAGEAAGGAKGFYLDDSFATAIQKLTDAADGNAIYYDLSGRRVAEPKQGLYIVNGKKVVVK